MLISVAEADTIIRRSIPTGGTETVPLAEAAGRVLRAAVKTPRPLPPYDRVMMDGIAVARSAYERGRRKFSVTGTLHAGEPEVRLAEVTHCWRVMTGAVCPAGADLVIPREFVTIEDAVAQVGSDFTVPENGYIHRRGADAPRDTVLLESGTRLDGVALGIAASCNCASVEVTRRPRVAIVSTGDELVEPGSPLEPHQIPRSNGFALTALLQRHLPLRVECHHLADDRAVLKEGFSALLETVDFLLCSGGVSKGDRDFLPAVLTALGVEAHFHGVAQRPGKPFWFGTGGNGVAVFALPGNPVSTLVGGRRYVVPAIAQWLGAAADEVPRLPLAEAFTFSPPLTGFVPVRHRGMTVVPAPVRNSGDFASLQGTTGFVELPAEKTVFRAGFEVPYFGW